MDSLGDALGDSISAQAGLLSELLTELTEPILVSAGLSRANFDILTAIAGARAGSQNEIARRLGLAPASLSEALDRLVEAGWVLREANKRDGRAKRVRLTDRGVNLVRETVKAVQAGEQAALASVARADAAIALRVLRTANRALAEAVSAQQKSSEN